LLALPLCGTPADTHPSIDLNGSVVFPYLRQLLQRAKTEAAARRQVLERWRSHCAAATPDAASLSLAPPGPPLQAPIDLRRAGIDASASGFWRSAVDVLNSLVPEDTPTACLHPDAVAVSQALRHSVRTQPGALAQKNMLMVPLAAAAVAAEDEEGASGRACVPASPSARDMLVTHAMKPYQVGALDWMLRREASAATPTPVPPLLPPLPFEGKAGGLLTSVRPAAAASATGLPAPVAPSPRVPIDAFAAYISSLQHPVAAPNSAHAPLQTPQPLTSAAGVSLLARAYSHPLFEPFDCHVLRWDPSAFLLQEKGAPARPSPASLSVVAPLHTRPCCAYFWNPNTGRLVLEPCASCLEGNAPTARVVKNASLAPKDDEGAAPAVDGATSEFNFDGQVAGGFLADDMGTGKTLACVALVCARPLTPQPFRHHILNIGMLHTYRIDGSAALQRCINECDPNRISGAIESLCGLGTSPSLVRSRATLIIVPASLCQQWVAEASKWAPQLAVYVYHGVAHLLATVQDQRQRTPTRNRHSNHGAFHEDDAIAIESSSNEVARATASMAMADIVVTSFSQLAQDIHYSNDRVGTNAVGRHSKRYASYKSPLVQIDFHRIILDEVQQLDHPGRGGSNLSARTTMALALHGERRWCVSGTPFSQADEIYAALCFLRYRPFADPLWWSTVLRPALLKGSHGFLAADDATIGRKRTVDELEPPKTDASSSPLERRFGCGLPLLRSLLVPLVHRNTKEHLQKRGQLLSPPVHHLVMRIKLEAAEDQYYRSLLARAREKVGPALRYLSFFRLGTKDNDNAASNADDTHDILAPSQTASVGLMSLMTWLKVSERARVQSAPTETEKLAILSGKLTETCTSLATELRLASSGVGSLASNNSFGSSLSPENRASEMDRLFDKVLLAGDAELDAAKRAAYRFYVMVGTACEIAAELLSSSSIGTSVPSTALDERRVRFVEDHVPHESLCVQQDCSVDEGRIRSLEDEAIKYYSAGWKLSEDHEISASTYTQEAGALRSWAAIDIAALSGIRRIRVRRGDHLGAEETRLVLQRQVVNPLLSGTLRLRLFTALNWLYFSVGRLHTPMEQILQDATTWQRSLPAQLVNEYRERCRGIQFPLHRMYVDEAISKGCMINCPRSHSVEREALWSFYLLGDSFNSKNEDGGPVSLVMDEDYVEQAEEEWLQRVHGMRASITTAPSFRLCSDLLKLNGPRANQPDDPEFIVRVLSTEKRLEKQRKAVEQLLLARRHAIVTDPMQRLLDALSPSGGNINQARWACMLEFRRKIAKKSTDHATMTDSSNVPPGRSFLHELTADAVPDVIPGAVDNEVLQWIKQVDIYGPGTPLRTVKTWVGGHMNLFHSLFDRAALETLLGQQQHDRSKYLPEGPLELWPQGALEILRDDCDRFTNRMRDILEFQRMTTEIRAREKEGLDARSEMWLAQSRMDLDCDGSIDAITRYKQRLDAELVYKLDVLKEKESMQTYRNRAAALAKRYYERRKHAAVIETKTKRETIPERILKAVSSSSIPVVEEARAEKMKPAAEAEDDDMRCMVCLSTDIDAPVLTPCAHIACRQCIQECMEHNLDKCPNCMRRLHLSELFCIDDRKSGKEVSLLPLANVFASSENGSSLKSSQEVPSWLPSTEEVNAQHDDPAFSQFGAKISSILRRILSLPEGEKAVIVSAWPKVLHLLKSAAERANIGLVQLAGPPTERALAIRAFTQSTQVKALLLDARQDCSGLTLTAASHLYILDALLSTADVVQLVGRIARIGQARECVVYHAVVEDTWDQTLLQRIFRNSRYGYGFFALNDSSEAGEPRTGQADEQPSTSEISFQDFIDFFGGNLES
jgi:hypothetical protein